MKERRESMQKNKKIILLLGILLLSVIFSACNKKESIDLDSQIYGIDEGAEIKESTIKEGDNDTPRKKEKTVENNERKLNDVIVEVTGKTSKPADINNWEYEDWVGFTLSVSNNTDKVIKGIQGTLEINDIFGEKIMRLNADLLGITINQGETVVIDDMGYGVNPFINEDVLIYELEYEDLKFNYIIKKIAFEDGTFLEYE